MVFLFFQYSTLLQFLLPTHKIEHRDAEIKRAKEEGSESERTLAREKQVEKSEEEDDGHRHSLSPNTTPAKSIVRREKRLEGVTGRWRNSGRAAAGGHGGDGSRPSR